MNKQVANVQLMQKMNRLKVLSFIRKNPDASRPQIAANTGLSLPSITNIVSYLLEIGIVRETGVEPVQRVGRKRTLLRLNAERYDLICISLDPEEIILRRTDLEGNPKETLRLATGKQSTAERIDSLCDALNSFIERENTPPVLGIGVAVSGLVLSGRFMFSAQLHWKSYDIRNVLEERTGLPVFVENISLLRAVWYISQKTRPHQGNMLFVDMKNGIGTVHCIDGAIQASTIGEIGHTTVEKDGPPCFCGNRGCLEAMCNPRRLLSLYASANGEEVASLAELEALMQTGDKAAQFSITECGRYLGIGLANLIALFNPSLLVINTGDYTDCPSLLEFAEKELKERDSLSLTDTLMSEKINTTEENTLRGMALHLCDSLFDLSFPGNIIE